MRMSATEDFLFGDGPDAHLLDLPRVRGGAGRRGRPAAQPAGDALVAAVRPDVAELRARATGGGAAGEPLVYGLCQAWNEDDVIYATVRNLFLEGAGRVFVIDDASDDATASEAMAAGATVIHDTSDGAFDELRRTRRIAQVIEEETEAAGRPVWWIVVDADEFPRGPEAATIGDLVRTLPPWVDTVGSRVLEHYPSARSAPKPRHHPLDELPNARWHNNPSCAAGHWKHQMLLVRRPGELRFMFGRHTIAAREGRRPVIESEASLLMHHFPLRDRERTERKFRLAGSDTGRYGASSDTFVKRRLEGRLRMLGLAYAERYDALPNTFPGEPKTGTSVADWRGLVAPAEREVRHRAGVVL